LGGGDMVDHAVFVIHHPTNKAQATLLHIINTQITETATNEHKAQNNTNSELQL